MILISNITIPACGMYNEEEEMIRNQIIHKHETLMSFKAKELLNDSLNRTRAKIHESDMPRATFYRIFGPILDNDLFKKRLLDSNSEDVLAISEQSLSCPFSLNGVHKNDFLILDKLKQYYKSDLCQNWEKEMIVSLCKK